jgi:hypothetical protein
MINDILRENKLAFLPIILNKDLTSLRILDRLLIAALKVFNLKEKT